MYVRTSTRRNADGTRVSYLQLAHNEWDPTAKTSRTKVLYSFGRADQLDRAAIERLIIALTRLVGVEPAPSARDRHPVAPPRGRDPAGSGGGAGAVRPGRQPGAGAVLEAGRHLVGRPRRAPDRPPRGVR